MDLTLILSKLFPGENVAPDLSSYEAMIGKWRGSKSPPTIEECQAAESDIKAEESVQAEEIKNKEYTIEEKVDALLKERNGDSSLIKPILEQLKSKK